MKQEMTKIELTPPEWLQRLHRGDSISIEIPQQKPLHERERHEFHAIVIGGSMLSFNAGFINSVTLFTSGLTASHVTGIITKSSIFLGAGQIFDFGMTFLILPLFIAGAAMSGILIPYSSFHIGRAYNTVFILGSLFLLLAMICHLSDPQSMAYVYLTVVACGMQNAMTTKYSNNILRTTHMTGAATDIGIVIGRIILGRRDEVWRLQVLCPMMFAFFMGGLLGSRAVLAVGEVAVVFNFLIFSGTGLLYVVYVASSKNISFFKALTLRSDFTEFHRKIRRHVLRKRSVHGGLGSTHNREVLNPISQPTAAPVSSGETSNGVGMSARDYMPAVVLSSMEDGPEAELESSSSSSSSEDGDFEENDAGEVDQRGAPNSDNIDYQV